MEIVLTTYRTYTNHASAFDEIPWRLLVCDEAHVIKNPKSSVTDAVGKLAERIAADVRECSGVIALTGTPVQNSLDDLHCLVHAVMPGILAQASMFKNHYTKTITFDSSASEFECALQRERSQQLSTIIRRLILRRTKALIAHQLPTKTDSVVFCQMSDVQLRAYTRLLASPDFRSLANAHEACACGARTKDGMPQSAYQCCAAVELAGGPLWRHFHPHNRTCDKCPTCIALPALTLLSKLANNVDLLKPDPSEPRDKQVL